MIFSRQYNFIFLKTSKTAGTSIEIALSRHCGPGDIVTPVTARDEKLRRPAGGRGPMGYAAPLTEHGMADWMRLLTRWRVRRRFYNHMPATEVRALLSAEVWERAFRFCVVRNPWDRVVSYYFHKFKREPRPLVDDFLTDEVLGKLRREGPGIYCIDGRVAVDQLCRYEELGAELQRVWQRLGLPGTPELPRAKGGHRDAKLHYSQVLSAQARERIAEAFADEIAWLGYQF